MTLLMCKFVDSEMDDEIMRENTVLFTPTSNEGNQKIVSDDGKEKAAKVSEEKSTNGIKSPGSPGKEGDSTSRIKAPDNEEHFDKTPEMELEKKRKTPDKTPLENENTDTSPKKKLKTFATEQTASEMDKSEKNATDPKQKIIPNIQHETEIGNLVKKGDENAAFSDRLEVINKVIETREDPTDQRRTVTETGNNLETKQDNDACIKESENVNSFEMDDKRNNESENIYSVETMDDKDSTKVNGVETKDDKDSISVNDVETNDVNESEMDNSVQTKPAKDDFETKEVEEAKNITISETLEIPPLGITSAIEPKLSNQKEINEDESTTEDKLETTDAENSSTKDITLSDDSHPQNLPNDDKKGEANEDSQDDKMEEIVNSDLNADPSQNTDGVEDMDDSELLTDPAILEAIKLSEITASKELDRAITASEEMEEESDEEEPEEPWTPEDYGIYSKVKEFGTMKLPKKALMKAFKKELAGIQFSPASEASPPGEIEPSKVNEKEETVSSQINFLLNIGLTPSAPTDSTKDKEAARLRRLDKLSKMSAKSKLRIGRRSLKRLEDRFRANLIRTVQQNTEVSTLCKEMLILDLNPTKYLWGSALLRKRELSKKLKEWFKEAKKSEAQELENPSSISAQDNPSLPSKLLRFTSCDTAPSPSLVLQIKIGKAGLDLKWQSTTDQQDFSLLATRHYELQCCHAATPWEQPTEWKTIGNIKAMPLPMACTIRKFEAGHIFSFRIRAVKSKKDRSEFSEPMSITL